MALVQAPRKHVSTGSRVTIFAVAAVILGLAIAFIQASRNASPVASIAVAGDASTGTQSGLGSNPVVSGSAEAALPTAPPTGQVAVAWGYWAQQVMAAAEEGVWARSTVTCEVPNDWMWAEPYPCVAVDDTGAMSMMPMYIQIAEAGNDFAFTYGDTTYIASDYLS